MKRLAERVLAAVFPHGPGEKIKRRALPIDKIGGAELASKLRQGDKMLDEWGSSPDVPLNKEIKKRQEKKEMPTTHTRNREAEEMLMGSAQATYGHAHESTIAPSGSSAKAVRGMSLSDERFARVEEELNVLHKLLKELDAFSDDKVSVILGSIPQNHEGKDPSPIGGNFVDMVIEMTLRCQRITRNITETIARL